MEVALSLSLPCLDWSPVVGGCPHMWLLGLCRDRALNTGTLPAVSGMRTQPFLVQKVLHCHKFHECVLREQLSTGALVTSVLLMTGAFSLSADCVWLFLRPGRD